VNTLGNSASGDELRALGVLDVGDDVLREFVGLEEVPQLGLRLHFVAEHRVVDLLVQRAFGLQVVLPLELLVVAGGVDCFGPVVLAECEVAEEGEDARLEVEVLAVELPEWAIPYSLTCSVRPFSSPYKFTIMLFSFYKQLSASRKYHYPKPKASPSLPSLPYFPGKTYLR